MTSGEIRKRWMISKTLLRRAREAVLIPDESVKEEFERLDAQFFDMVDHNEYELALDMLEEIGWITQPRGGFWKDLIRTAANMKLDGRIPQLKAEFDKALARIKEAEQVSASNVDRPPI